jgi:hypothetical protein
LKVLISIWRILMDAALFIARPGIRKPKLMISWNIRLLCFNYRLSRNLALRLELILP